MATKETILAGLNDMGMKASPEVLNKCLELCQTYNIDSEEFVDTWCSFAASNINNSELNINNLIKLERKEFQQRKHEVQNFRKEIDYENEKMDNSFTNNVEETISNAILPSIQNLNTSCTDLLNKTLTGYDAASEMNKYFSRTDSRKILHSYGETINNLQSMENFELHIKDLKEFNPNFLYMYEIMGREARSLTSLSQFLATEILNANNLTVSDVILKNTTGPVVTFGRIISELNEKLNINSVYLEITHGANIGYVVKLNLNKCTSISLFSGQTVVVEGNHILNRNLLVVEKIFTSAPLQLPSEPFNLQNNLEIVVAAGPFTLLGNINYDPLNDLLKYVIEYKPNILILIGPFISENHDNINDPAFFKSFETTFEDIIETIINQLRSINIEIVIISSSKDVHQHPIFPTPPYKLTQKHDNLHFVCDPCMINVNGVVIGATSVDTLLDIGNNSLIFNSSNDRFGSLCKLLLDQKNFYPLYPPREELDIDYDLAETYILMDCMPHILILPSTFKHFVKSLNNCLVVNPERLTKGYAAGTFARIQIKSGTGTSVHNQTCCQILRV